MKHPMEYLPDLEELIQYMEEAAEKDGCSREDALSLFTTKDSHAGQALEEALGNWFARFIKLPPEWEED